MKKYIFILFAIFLVNCSEDLLDTAPQTEMTEGNYYQNPNHARAAVTSAYDVLSWFEFFEVQYMMIVDGASDDAECENSTLDNFVGYNASHEIFSSMWETFYIGVFRCNIVFDKLPGIDMDEQLRERYIAEAKFLRALYYYYIVTHFGNAAIVEKVYGLDEMKDITNATKEEIYTFMETDLLEAIEVLPLSYDAANTGRATKGAAQGLLGKIYLHQNKWQEAAGMFEAVINSGQYSLVRFPDPYHNDSAAYVDAFLAIFTPDPWVGRPGDDRPAIGGENNEESVFEVQLTDHVEFPDGGPFLGWGNAGSHRFLFLNSKSHNAYGNVWPSVSFIEEFEPGPDGMQYDPRKYASVWDVGEVLSFDPNSMYFDVPYTTSLSPDEDYLIKKTVYPIWEGDASTVSDINWRVIRYADILLMYAEALDQGASSAIGATPASLINEVRDRVGMPPVENSDNMAQAVIHERRVELGFESSRFIDLLRWNQNGYLDKAGINLYDLIPESIELPKYYAFPIPQSQIDLSSALKQNPNWTE